MHATPWALLCALATCAADPGQHAHCSGQGDCVVPSDMCHEGRCIAAVDYSVLVTGLSCNDVGAESDMVEALSKAVGAPFELHYSISTTSGCLSHGRAPTETVMTATEILPAVAHTFDSMGYMHTSILLKQPGRFHVASCLTNDSLSVLTLPHRSAPETPCANNATLRHVVLDDVCYATLCADVHHIEVQDNDGYESSICMPTMKVKKPMMSETSVTTVVASVIGGLVGLIVALLLVRHCACKSHDPADVEEFKRMSSLRKEPAYEMSESGQRVASFRGSASGSTSPRSPMSARRLLTSEGSSRPNSPRSTAVTADFSACDSASFNTRYVDANDNASFSSRRCDSSRREPIFEGADADHVVPPLEFGEFVDESGVEVGEEVANAPCCGCCGRTFVTEAGKSSEFDEFLSSGKRGLLQGLNSQHLLIDRNDTTLFCLNCHQPEPAFLGLPSESSEPVDPEPTPVVLPANVQVKDVTRAEISKELAAAFSVIRPVKKADESMLTEAVAKLFDDETTMAVTKVENGEANTPSSVSTFSQNLTRRWYRWKKPVFSWLCVLVLLVGAFFWYFFNHTDGPATELLGMWLPVAKGNAQMIKVSCVLLMMAGCRHTTTLITNRSWFEGLFGQTIALHQYVGMAVMLFSIIHVVCACRNYHVLITKYNKDAYELLVNNYPFITGILCLLFQIVPTIVARMYVSVKKHFNVFYSTHMGLILFLICLCFHTKPSARPRLYAPAGQLDGRSDTIWWILPFLLLYLGEMAYRRFYCAKRPVEVVNEKTKVYSVGEGPKGDARILKLTMKRKDHVGCFSSFRPGQYVMLQDETVSRWEWHPFTVSDLRDDEVELQIKECGDWTGAFIDRFAANAAQDTPAQITLGLDGPFSAPAQGYKSFSTMVFIGAGIGVTPFLSIASKLIREKSKQVTKGETTHVHFIYLVNDLGAVTIVEDVLTAMRAVDSPGLEFTIQVCLTGGAVRKLSSDKFSLPAKPAEDGSEVEKHTNFDLLKLAQHYILAERQKDLLTQLPVLTHFGRPTWREIFTDLGILNTSTEVGVFACGNPALVNDLEAECLMFNSTYAEYDFRPEMF